MEAWVATGMKIGSGTGPCGSLRVLARAFVVCGYQIVPAAQRSRWLTEHLACRSKVNAEGVDRVAVDMVAMRPLGARECSAGRL
jgi:hypothetical protein